MMAPNPQWWAEDAEVYFYIRGKFNPGLFVMFFWLAFTVIPLVWPASKVPLLVVAIIAFVGLLIYSGLPQEPPLHHFETRYAFITQYHGDEILVHESMRDLVSLEPVNHRKTGKLEYNEAKFWNGKSMKIYPSLERHDELIAKMKEYLSANGQLQTADS